MTQQTINFEDLAVLAQAPAPAGEMLLIQNSQAYRVAVSNVVAAGADGNTGWSPRFALIADGTRIVLQLAAWIGGTGTAPSGVNSYLGTAGLVTAIADAVDIRGPIGPPATVIAAEEGTSLGEFSSINFVGAAVTAVLSGTALTVTFTGQSAPLLTDEIYFGLSTDAVPTGAELTIAGVNGVGTIPAFANMYQLIARMISEDDINSAIFSDDSSMTNQIGAFTKFGSTVIPAGESQQFAVWVSNQLLTQPEQATATVN